MLNLLLKALCVYSCESEQAPHLRETGASMAFAKIYGTDLMERCIRKWRALESNPLSIKILSIHHRVRVDALVKYARRKHSQQALTE